MRITRPVRGPELHWRFVQKAVGALFLCALAVFWPAGQANVGALQRIIINSSYPTPYSTPERDGYFDLLLIEAFARLGYMVQINNLPAQRSLTDAAKGMADGDIGRVAGLDHTYTTLIPVPEPALDRREFVAFSRTVDIPTTDWSALEPYNIAYVEGWQVFTNIIGKAQSVTALRTTKDLFRFLDLGRCDIALSARLEGMTMLRKLGMTDVKILEPPLAAMPMYLYLHESRRNLVYPLAETFKEMKEDGAVKYIREQVMKKYIEF
ncbi:MAG: substrate-binding periplasmic protein [Oceanidesulfovibrio sp.]